MMSWFYSKKIIKCTFKSDNVLNKLGLTVRITIRV